MKNILQILVVATMGASAYAAGDSVGLDKDRKALVSGHPAEQQAAMVRLSNSDDDAVGMLVDVIGNEKDRFAKARAGRALQESLKKRKNRSNRAIQQVEKLLDNPDSAVSEQGMLAAMQFKGDMRARKMIRRLAKGSGDPIIRAKALGALLVNSNHDKSEVPFVSEFLKDNSEYVRVWAAGYLGELGDKSGLPLINEVLGRQPADDTSRALILRAAVAAGRIGDKSSLALLKTVEGSDKYGSATWEASLAVKEIEMKNAGDEQQRATYLKSALDNPTYSRWAAGKLIREKNAKAREVLGNAKKSKNPNAANEAARAEALAASEASQDAGK